MASKTLVLKSINNADESRCVDIFQRRDSTYGFEEFRRDVEDNRGWFPIGFYSGQNFSTEEEALSQAIAKIGWLQDLSSQQ